MTSRAHVRRPAPTLVLVFAAAIASASCGTEGTTRTCEDGCRTLPPAECNGDVQVTYEEQGTCLFGSCSFASTRVACEFGCDEGACRTVDPCADVTCDAPPAPTCDGNSLVSFDAGVCLEGGCRYTEVVTRCGDTSQVCHQGACIDPCDVVTCDMPPDDDCVANQAVVYGSSGTCERGACSYDSDRQDCFASDQVCFGGACLTSECDCNTPPADRCDGEVAHQFQSLGVCPDGAGSACEYHESVADCAADERFCLDGECVDFNPCVGVVCNESPDAVCDGAVLVTFAARGTCAAGECTYTETRTSCADSGQFCIGGTCTDADPCEEVGCARPDATCDDDGMRVTYSGAGECVAGLCDFSAVETVEACGSGSICAEGECQPYPGPGDVVVSELLYDPAGNDDLFEWFELLNTTDMDLYIGGMTIRDEGDDVIHAPDGVVIPARGLIVFGQSASAAPGNVNVNWAGPDRLTFDNDADELILEWEGELIDRVAYDESDGWPDADGYSLALDPRFFDATANDDPSRWCFGIDVYHPDILTLGSPNVVNPVCDFECFDVGCGLLDAYCDGGTAVGYVGEGICTDAGECDYSMVETRTDCRAIGADFNCAAGACIDVCVGLVCEDPPNPTCFGNRRVTFEDVGSCERGVCIYDVGVEDPCPSGTVCDASGAAPICVDDPCADVDCSAPAPFCDGLTAVTYDGSGVCVDGVCDDTDITETRTDCVDGAICVAGTCSEVAGPGDIIISEMMIDPPLGDRTREWFELANTTGLDLSIGGMVVTDAGTDSFTVDDGTVIPANGFYVFASSADALPAGFIDAIYPNDNMRLGANDEIILTLGGVEIDRVEYVQIDWPPYEEGESLSLDPTAFDVDANNSPLNWCFGVAWYELPGTDPPVSGQGSPGLANPDCP